MNRSRARPVLRENHTRVKNLYTDFEGTVESVLSTQVTVKWDTGVVGFCTYSDYGIDWTTVGEKT